MRQAQDRGPRDPNRINAVVDGGASILFLGLGAFLLWKGGKGSAGVAGLLAGMSVCYGVSSFNALKKMRAADAINALEAEIPEIVSDSSTRPLTAPDVKSISFEPRSEWDGDAKSHPIIATTWPVEDIVSREMLGSEEQVIALIPLSQDQKRTAYQPVLLSTLQAHLRASPSATIDEEAGEVQFANFYNVPVRLQDVIIVTSAMFNEKYDPDYRPAEHLKMA